jgi:hypothetical protein
LLEIPLSKTGKYIYHWCCWWWIHLAGNFIA